jgi:hypothetical protein
VYKADAGRSQSEDDAGKGMAESPALYPATRTHSPITAALAANLRRIAALGPQQSGAVFAKVGDSHTVSRSFLHCFAGANVDLGGRTELVPALERFRKGVAGATTPFDRDSLAAKVGWSAWSVIAAGAGTGSPLAKERLAIHPRYAVVMFGTNDLESRNLGGFAENLFAIADQLIAAGTVPLFSSVPPRDDDAADDAWVPRYNAVARGVAQARQVPFMDLHRELLGLTGHGMAGDGIHLDTYVAGGVRPCALTADGLRHGNNVRNLVTLEALSRAVLALDGSPPDAAALSQRGAGTRDDPFVIDALPFTDLRSTATAGESRIDRYGGCGAAQDESGPEVVYRLVLPRQARVRAMVFSRGGADIDVHVLDGSATGEGCRARDDTGVSVVLPAGTWHLSLDSFVPKGGGARAKPMSGEYLLVVLADPP